VRLPSLLRSLCCAVVCAASAVPATGLVSVYYPSWMGASSLDSYDFSKIDLAYYAFYEPDRSGNPLGDLNTELVTGLVARSHAAGAKCLLSFVGGSGGTTIPIR